jgi:regulator of protease activity HflC (stomatin/prohibitin superfamily)
VSDDLATQSGTTRSSDDQPPAVPYVQITETWASQDEVADAIDRRDSLGRVPVVVRVKLRTPLRGELFLIAVGLGVAALILPAGPALRALLVVVAIGAVGAALLSRLFIRVPPGTVGLVMRSGRHDRVLQNGIHPVKPVLVLTHIVTTRKIAFDVPVSEVRSADGVAITVELLLTIGITDPAKLVYAMTTSDLDQLAQASTQDAVRRLIRGIDALAALDLGPAEADTLRAVIDEKLAPYGVDVEAAAFTRVTLPAPLTASLEARRLATVQLAEAEQVHALDRRRMSDRASLLSQEAELRRSAVDHEAAAEALRLAKLEERIGSAPHAARYDLEQARLRVAQQLAGNTRAVVSLGGRDLIGDLLLAREATANGHDGLADGTTVPAPNGTTPAANGPIPADVAEPAPVAASAAKPARAARTRA